MVTRRNIPSPPGEPPRRPRNRWHLPAEDKNDGRPREDGLLFLEPCPQESAAAGDGGEVSQRIANLEHLVEKLATEVAESRRSADKQRERERELERINAEERKRIGRELHDVVGQRLSAIAFLLGTLDPGTDNARRRENWSTIQTELAAVRQDLRVISTGLLPAGIGEHGLRQALADLLGRAERFCNVQGHLTWQLEVLPADTLAEQLYWIAYEAVCNVCKHACASQVSISLVGTPERLTLAIADDGAGLPAGVELSGNGVGMRLMRYRSRLVDGDFDIAPNHPQGTRVIVTVPR